MIFETNITNSKPQIVSKCHNMINVHKSRRVFQPNFVQLILKGWKHNFQEFCAMIWGISCLQFCKKSADHKEGNTCSEVPIFPSLFSSSLAKLETSRTVILPPTVSVLWSWEQFFHKSSPNIRQTLSLF